MGTTPDRPAIDELLVGFQERLGPRLRAVYAYGATLGDDGDTQRRLLVLVDELDLRALQAAGPIAVEARRGGMHVRVDTAQDLLRGADAFPVFSLALLGGRELLLGDDLLRTLEVNPQDLRLHLEQALRKLLHELTDQFLFAPRNTLRIGRQLRRTGRRLVYLLEGLLILRGELERPTGEHAPDRSPEDVLRASHSVLTTPERETLDELWRIAGSDAPLQGDALYRLYGSTLGVLKSLVNLVDTHT